MRIAMGARLRQLGEKVEEQKRSFFGDKHVEGFRGALVAAVAQNT